MSADSISILLTRTVKNLTYNVGYIFNMYVRNQKRKIKGGKAPFLFLSYYFLELFETLKINIMSLITQSGNFMQYNLPKS